MNEGVYHSVRMHCAVETSIDYPKAERFLYGRKSVVIVGGGLGGTSELSLL